jgi:hypothetical protein
MSPRRSAEARMEALRELIVYNFADVDAMRHIFDACLPRLEPVKVLGKRYGGRFGALSRRPDFDGLFPFSLATF